MKLKEVSKYLEERGHPLTRASLYRAGLKNGFLTREPCGKTSRYIVDKTKLDEWLDNATKKLPVDYMTLRELSEVLKCSYSMLDKMCKSGEVRVVKCGAGSGVRYVRFDEAEAIVRIHRENN